MKKLITALSIVAAMAFAVPAVAKEDPMKVPGAKTINAMQAKKLFDQGVIFVDVRRDKIFAKGRIPDAVHIEMRKVYNQQTLGEHVKLNQKVVIYYDGTCKRCYKAVEQAVSWGFAKVYYFRDGYDAWVGAGYPVE